MSIPSFVSADEIRSRFSRAMSQMYRQEVPQYGTLLDLVADINTATLQADPARREALERSGGMDRLDDERHGAIRLGTGQELATMRRIFAVMGMSPVGYYDLSVAGVPVHSTAFRPVSDEALAINPFRMFTSLLRLELVADARVREEADNILQQRRIFTDGALALLDTFEQSGGLTSAQADDFVDQVRETFRWHREATVGAETYRSLHDAHRLIADVVCFKGPHINHLTPRILDIDAAQLEMPRRGVAAKEVIEGPPPRQHGLLLRQTSFKALEEKVAFADGDGAGAGTGTHTARFGEIEQRGMALTRKGRALYDELLNRARDDAPQGSGVSGSYSERLAEAFTAFPDDLLEIHRQGLAFFRYSAPGDADTEGLMTAVRAAASPSNPDRLADLHKLVLSKRLQAEPITYEDFLPVSAAGIFQSNLGGTGQKNYASNEARTAFEAALGAEVLDEISLYEAAQMRSLHRLLPGSL
ncbi:MAG: VOC family protein [Comamonadaceae bacterium]|nr:MAG: VOC family protein [Comamonadaceae bacterium]